MHVSSNAEAHPLSEDLLLVCSGYLVENGRVLLVHHNGFNKWVPPGGHVEPGETFSQTAKREFIEETGLQVTVLSASSLSYADSNAVAEPSPFYVDLAKDGFRKPALIQYFYVRQCADSSGVVDYQREELFGAGWFNLEELKRLETFEQVRVVARHAFANHPNTIG
jgi:8-oxo-dGTP pyrophosphatase MutT (NUDIX family)